MHKSRAAGSAGRTRMTAVVWGSPFQGGNNVLVAAALDGSLVMWSGDGPFARPAAEIREAHKPNTWTGGIDISSDGRMVVTRGGDDLIKLWDTRKFKTPVVTVSHPSTSDHYSATNIKYSPTSSSIITGSASGHLHILNPGNLKPELVTPVTPGYPLITVGGTPKSIRLSLVLPMPKFMSYTIQIHLFVARLMLCLERQRNATLTMTPILRQISL